MPAIHLDPSRGPLIVEEEEEEDQMGGTFPHRAVPMPPAHAAGFLATRRSGVTDRKHNMERLKTVLIANR